MSSKVNLVCFSLICKHHCKSYSCKIMYTFLFLFVNAMLIITAGIHQMLVRIANREDPDQTAASEGCLYFFGWQLVCERLSSYISTKQCRPGKSSIRAGTVW